MTLDPRPSVIGRRLAAVGRLVPVTGGKGGIGKSVVSACLALDLAERGLKAGLLDLDFSSPSQHVLLGVDGSVFPREEQGLIPPEVGGVRLMTMAFFSKDNPAPMRGADLTNAMIELLCVTRWGRLDCLIVDMPPGISDAALDTMRLMREGRPLLVTTPSKLSIETLRKVVRTLDGSKNGALGILENMRRGGGSPVEDEARDAGLPYLGAVGFDPKLEETIGDPAKLLKSRAGRDIAKLAASIPALKV